MAPAAAAAQTLPKAARRRASPPVDPAQAEIDAMVGAEMDEMKLDGTTAAAEAAAAAARGEAVPFDPTDDPAEQAMLSAARGLPVFQPPVAIFEEAEPANLDAEDEIVPPWDGRSISFRLAFPMQDIGKVIHEGTVMTFRCSPWRDSRGKTRFCGPGTDDDPSEMVEYYYNRGMFLTTKPYYERLREQMMIDMERGVYQGAVYGADASGQPLVTAPLRSVAQADGARLESQLRRVRGIGPAAAMQAAERVAATAGTEAPGSGGPRQSRE